MTINGNFAQTAGSTLEIEVKAAGASDLLDVNGSATLDSTVTFSQDGGGTIADGTVYTFIQTTGGVAGNFATFADNLAF